MQRAGFLARPMGFPARLTGSLGWLLRHRLLECWSAQVYLSALACPLVEVCWSAGAYALMLQSAAPALALDRRRHKPQQSMQPSIS